MKPICLLAMFAACAADGAFVAGLHWPIALDGAPVESDPNCISPRDTPAVYTVTATAGGVSTETVLTTN